MRGRRGSGRGRRSPPPALPQTSSDLLRWQQKLPGLSLYYNGGFPNFPGAENHFGVIWNHLKTFVSATNLSGIEKTEYFEVRIEQLAVDSRIRSEWADFLQDVSIHAAEISRLFGAIMHKIIYEWKNAGRTVETDDVNRIQGGLMRFEPLMPLIRINSQSIGKFVTLRGTIVRTGPVTAKTVQLGFSCPVCNLEFSVQLLNGVYTNPCQCGANRNCRNRKFEVVENSKLTVVSPSQNIRLQDVIKTDADVGDVPRMIECQLSHSLVNTCNNGDTVTLTGVVRMKKDCAVSGEQNLHQFFVEVIGVKNHKESKLTLGGHWFSLSPIDFCAIGEIHDSPFLFRLLVASLSPLICGHELVKAGLLLSLFGGSTAESRRDDINILMVGDPGIGKSQLLKCIAEIAPRAVYICGTGSTVAGLTVTLVREGDGFAVEAGALVMADCGTCCIDEFDKMPQLHNALLEAMEQQSVSVAKSGILRTFPARTTVVAAANPIEGHYDKCKSFTENIKTNPAVLSRFDIVFLMLDTPDLELDRRIVDHIMGTKSPNLSPANSSPPLALRDSLKVGARERMDLIPYHLIRKYIAYARQYVRPKLNCEAKAALKEYYLRLRSYRSPKSAPVTTRQLESLIRLTEARAKLELREVATLEDANEVLEIFDSGFFGMFNTSLANLDHLIPQDTDTQKAGPSGVKNQANQLMKDLVATAERSSKFIYTVNEIQCVMMKGKYTATVDTLVTILNDQGKLLKKGRQTFEMTHITQSSNYYPLVPTPSDVPMYFSSKEMSFKFEQMVDLKLSIRNLPTCNSIRRSDMQHVFSHIGTVISLSSRI